MTEGAGSTATEACAEHVPNRKECQILSAARTQFLEQGFADTSMDAIARAAGVSKATLYAYFPSKEALFRNLIEIECSQKCTDVPEPDFGAGVEQALRELCGHFVARFLTKEWAAFFQAVSSERWRYPELCHLYFNSGKQNVLDLVSNYLEEAKARGLLAIDDAQMAAEHLLHLTVSDLPMRVALGLDLRSEAEYQRVMESGLAVFLKAYKA
ncbi:TetR/AcrR family transcriptional regulator [Methylosinus sporium]|uniref:TetR/AcrR family transcriptional regulator n=1 Tax=Methylosinus sporium TaxID=428 RepID=A0A2U1SRC1_METSR|nr:TetR/AcrR family transcriptional regulator [Methylosinus sporium]PWB94161.1 TetR/AcrR family transcriptional regulator [Methylosinus sporium]